MSAEPCARCWIYSRGLVHTEAIVGERTIPLLLCADCRDYMRRWNRHAMGELARGNSPVPADPQMAEALEHVDLEAS